MQLPAYAVANADVAQSEMVPVENEIMQHSLKDDSGQSLLVLHKRTVATLHTVVGSMVAQVEVHTDDPLVGVQRGMLPDVSRVAQHAVLVQSDG